MSLGEENGVEGEDLSIIVFCMAKDFELLIL